MISAAAVVGAAVEVLVVKLALEQATKAQTGARWEWVVNATPLPLYPREGGPVSIV